MSVSRAVRIAAIVAISAVGAFNLLYRLGDVDWTTDELTYKASGLLAIHGEPLLAPEHPPLAQRVLGLFQVLFGESATSLRLSAIIAGVLTGIVLALIAWRIADIWAALATAAVWFALPHPYDMKLERFALLDIFMAMFTTGAILAIVWWGKSRSWPWIIAAGGAAGAAAACKLPGVLVLGPVVGYVIARGKITRRTALQTGALLGTAAATFVATFVPFWGSMPAGIRYMVRYQERQRVRGHVVLVGDHFYKHPPWWTQFRWQWDASWLLAIAMLVVVIAAIAIAVVRRDPDRILLLSVLAFLIVFFAFGSGNLLRHYPYAWAPVFAVITGITLRDLALSRGFSRALCIVLVFALAIPAAQLLHSTATIRRTDYSLAADEVRAALGPEPTVGLLGYADVFRAYLPHAHTIPAATPYVERADAVIIDPVTAHGRTELWEKAVAAHTENLELRKIGRLLVYLPRD